MWSSEAADGRREVVWARTGEKRTTREDREQKTRGFRGILSERVNNREKEKKRGCCGKWFRGKEVKRFRREKNKARLTQAQPGTFY